MERFYETIFILRPTLNDQEINESIESYKDLLVREGATMLKQEDMGKKKLAYLIKHFQNGHYVLFQYRSLPPAVMELERTFKISEDILRFITVKLDPKKMTAEEKTPTAEETPTTAEETPTTEEEKPTTEEETPTTEEETPTATADAAPAAAEE